MRIWLRWLGLGVVCAAAVVASFSTLAALAEFTGWAAWASWLLPLSLDALGMTACLVWLDGTAPKKARRYAAWMTWIAAGLSVVGNGTGHLVSTGHLQQGLLLVVLVGSVPPAALAVTVHLIVSVSAPARPAVRDAAPAPVETQVETQVETPDLTSSTSTSGPASTSGPTSGPTSSPTSSPTSGQAAGRTSPKRQVGTRSKPKVEPRSETKVDEVELQRARHADRAYQTVNEGQPITRDALKKALGCGTDKAAALLAALKKEREAA